MTSVFFWLMMVSIAMADLPVPRSPMMSSRCPRPMGIMESMGLRPVCRGSFTGCRFTIPGATTSIWRGPSTGSMGPESVQGLSQWVHHPTHVARAPTGTSRTFPVRRT